MLVWVLGILLASVVAGVSAAALSGWVTQRLLARDSQVLPSLPSYVEAAGEDEALRFYGAVHDLAMTVTEAWNIARSRTMRPQLETVLDRQALASRCEDVHKTADALHRRMQGFDKVMERAHMSWIALDKVWHYERKDHNTVTMVPIMINGTVTLQQQSVYSHSDHIYTWRAEALREAERQLEALAATFDSTELYRPNLGKNHVALNQLEPAHQSLAERLVRQNVLRTDGEIVPEQVDLWVNQWISGAEIDQLLGEAVGSLNQVNAYAARGAQETRACKSRLEYQAQTTKFEGPEGYRRIESLKDALSKSMDSYRKQYETLKSCREVADQLAEWSADPSRIEPDRAYMGRAIKVYGLAFPNSEISIDRLPSQGWPAVMGAAIGVVAAGATIGAGTILLLLSVA